jgi:hypothetical protein
MGLIFRRARTRPDAHGGIRPRLTFILKSFDREGLSSSLHENPLSCSPLLRFLIHEGTDTGPI